MREALLNTVRHHYRPYSHTGSATRRQDVGGGLGNGQQAWNALYAKYHNNSKEVRRTARRR